MDDLSKDAEESQTVVPLVRQITEDGRSKLEIYRPTTNPIYIYTQVSKSFTFLYQPGTNRELETKRGHS